MGYLALRQTCNLSWWMNAINQKKGDGYRQRFIFYICGVQRSMEGTNQWPKATDL